MFELLAFVAGCVATGWVAHKRPTWFNSAVAFVNAVDDKVKTTVNTTVVK